MTDYNDMAYFALKAECKKQGLNGKGTKVELLARLGVTDTSPSPSPTDTPPSPTDNLQSPKGKTLHNSTPTHLFLPWDTHKRPVDNSRYAAHLTTERLSELENMLAPLAASKGYFKFELDYDNGAFQVGFYGGAAGPASTTLCDSDTSIVRIARHYFSARLVQGKNGSTSRL